MIINLPSGTTKGYLGKFAPPNTSEPAWVGSLLTTNNTWVALPNTNFKTYQLATIPAGSFIGTDPFAAPVNAYCDPVTNGKYQWFYGGGHGDGTNNSVTRFDWETLQYSMTAFPTPPEKYPRDYGVDRLLPANSPPGSAIQPGPLRYANGDTPGYFDPNPVHGAYSAPFKARPSSHMYDAAVYVNGKAYYLYGNPAVFNLNTGIWENVNHVDYGAQLNALSTSFGTGGFNTQCSFKWDSLTNRIWGTLVPGDGSGFRWHMVRINPITETIEAAISIGTNMIGNGSTLVAVGRWLYSFKASQTSYNSPVSFNTGFRILMDSPYTVEAIACSGTLAPARNAGSGFEVLSSTYNALSNRIIRADYAGNSGTLYEINPEPISGAGTFADPKLLAQTSRALNNSLPLPAFYVYSRAMLLPNTQVLCLLPQGNSNAYAVKLG